MPRRMSLVALLTVGALLTGGTVAHAAADGTAAPIPARGLAGRAAADPFSPHPGANKNKSKNKNDQRQRGDQGQGQNQKLLRDFTQVLSPVQQSTTQSRALPDNRQLAHSRTITSNTQKTDSHVRNSSAQKTRQSANGRQNAGDQQNAAQSRKNPRNEPAPKPCDPNIRVMTQNMYLGSNFAPLIAAQTLPQFLAGVTTVYQNIIASAPAERAAAVAREIARNEPDLVGLQEVDIVRTGSRPAENVQSDQLNALLAELDRLGHHYETVGIMPGTDIEVPSTLGIDVRLTYRDVVIVRADAARKITLSNRQVQTYVINSTQRSPAGTITDIRGWISVDATVCGRTFRFVNTHLDSTPPLTVQRAQAQELVASAANTRLPVVFVGDFNANASDPDDPTFATYRFLLDQGFSDAWRFRHSGDPGFTCCQAPDLRNSVSSLSRRIDLVLFRGAFGVKNINVIGNRQTDRTPLGLWPSDHAGVVATLRLPGRT
ncbi:endonuclease/exonuclease/phosphatase family protein [Microbispora hainanensis]|uniref:endonuclease/exonuclease/phosphatase family protein n=2 Tax=Microbispora hainanensis TaxID=568844 RepID=UPI0033D2FC15